MLRATSVSTDEGHAPCDVVVLGHEDRHLRRKVLRMRSGADLLVDLVRPAVLINGNRLVLTDGRHVEVIAAVEDLMEVRAKDSAALARLAWHIGNRHLAAQIERDRILLARDHVIRDLLIGLDACLTDVSETFEPERGAYHRHGEALGHHPHERHEQST